MSPRRPKLLVSVRNADEACTALLGGADIIDVKEPARGALGMAPVTVIEEVLQAVRSRCGDGPQPQPGGTAGPGAGPPAPLVRHRHTAVPVSAALGEAIDWRLHPVPSLPCQLAFLKLGLSRLAGIPDWPQCWLELRRRFEAASSGTPHWIAVIYADAMTAAAPQPQSIIGAAAESGCAGVLFDTFQKRSAGLLDLMPLQSLAAHLEMARAAGLITAVAGGLTLATVSELRSLAVDVVAVRGAACRNQDRRGPVCSQSVAELARRIRRPATADD